MAQQRRSGITLLSIGIAVGITVPYAVMLVQMLRSVFDASSVSRERLQDLSTLGFFFSPEEFRNVMAILSAFMGAITFIVLIIIIGLLARRQWAREAAFVVFGIMGLIAAVAFVGSAFADPVPGGIWLAMATMLCCGAIVGLLLLPRVTLDLEMAELARQDSSRPAA